VQSSTTEVDVDDISMKPPKSSAALRDAIVKAKREAAKKKAFEGQRKQNTQSSVGSATRGVRSTDMQDGLDDTIGIRPRIRTALRCGHLNVAGMGFRSIPEDIKQMYNSCADLGITWSECVDLTKVIAADNDLEKLDDDFFPDVSDQELADAEVSDYNSQFRGLGTLDLHGNLLQELPLGLRRLQNLHVLNLSGNKLEMSAFEVICQIGDSLTELRISDNQLAGALPEGLIQLRNLQVLDVHANKISELRTDLQELVHLKVLNLARNNISLIPTPFWTSPSLVQLIVANNQLSKILIPQEVRSMPTLKLLDASHNALEELSTGEAALSNIQTLNINGNRLKKLADVSGWTDLLTLSAAENLLTEIPEGFTKLPGLRNADFSLNNIKKLDDQIAFMENLVSLNLAGNPLVQRKYLVMSAEDLKTDLRKRVEAFDS
jgi:Leucine-rich repeat (LRR) protein